MSVAQTLRGRLIDYDRPGSLAARSRGRRWQLLLTSLPDLASLRVVDLGGTVESWIHAPVRPQHVTLVNLAPVTARPPEWATVVKGDACEVSDELGPFDLVYCNSVIEHVGGFARREQLARCVDRLAPRHWVQTPYRYFPIEPHWLFPGFQFLPLAVRARVAVAWKINPWPSGDVHEGVYDSLCVELLTKTEMAHLFPKSTILMERSCGMVKSLIACRT